MKVLIVAAELRPLAVVGGLGDVIGALPKALKSIGVDARIVIPKYGVVDEKEYPLKKAAENVTVPFSGKKESVDIYTTPLPGSEVPVYLIDHKKYLGENGIYFEKDASSSGSKREVERFLFYVRSALEIFEPIDWWPDVIHFHDWHVGLTPVLTKLRAKEDDRYAKIKLLLTIHNLAYQGWYKPEDVFSTLNITESDWPTLSERSGENADLNSLQQGILNADLISTVSPNYAQEIMTPEYGENLEETLKKRKNDIVGILNGIDVDRFNPTTDEHLVAPYTSDNLDGKAICKKDIQKMVGLPERDVPLIGVVSRLTDQKGIDIIEEAMSEILKDEDVQFIGLGTGTKEDEKRMENLVKSFKDKAKVAIEFNYPFAQKIYAGSDMFLIPSRFEPCGLTQMISMRYGAVPIVRATGGLVDTVRDFDINTKEGDGFVFDDYDAAQFEEAIRRALITYSKDRESWDAMVKSDMERDFSWTKSAKEFVKLYEKLVQ